MILPSGKQAKAFFRESVGLYPCQEAAVQVRLLALNKTLRLSRDASLTHHKDSIGLNYPR